MKQPFYTRRGDDGYTGLLGEGRIPKDDQRVEALGAVDEANSALAVARSLARAAGASATLLQVQRDLYGLMGELAATPQTVERFRAIDAARVAWLEAQVDALNARINLPREFIVPGDTVAGAFLDVARTSVRRAERRVVAFYRAGGFDNLEVLRYLNRLSSLCFLLQVDEVQTAGDAGITLAKG